jgi:PAP2 superfamily
MVSFIATQVLESKNVTLNKAAETYAKLGLALADAFVLTWDAKYKFNVLRPVSYVQKIISPDWQPLLVTPPFPEYPSGHSVQSAAAAIVLTDLFGSLPFADHAHDMQALAARTFSSFEQAADEATLSRLYGGIHFRAAVENGLELGRCIGDTVLQLSFNH